MIDFHHRPVMEFAFPKRIREGDESIKGSCRTESTNIQSMFTGGSLNDTSYILLPLWPEFIHVLMPKDILSCNLLNLTSDASDGETLGSM